MKTLVPIPITKYNFLPYGQCWMISMPNSKTTPDLETDALFVALNRPLRLGITYSTGGDFTCSEMERHNSTEEFLFSGDTELILAVSNSPADKLPDTQDIQAFILSPGTVICLNRGIWHAACHPIGNDSYYYFMAHNNGAPDETRWFPVTPDPVMIQVPDHLTVADRKSSIFFGKHHDSHKHYDSQCSNKTQNTSEPAQLIRFQDNQVCIGNGWKCWMTGDDCLEGRGQLRMHMFPTGQSVNMSFKNKNSIIFCGSHILNCRFSSNKANNILLHPGEMLKLGPSSEQILLTARTDKKDARKEMPWGWFYTISGG